MSNKLTRRSALGLSGAMLGSIAFNEDGLWRAARAEDKVTVGVVGGSWGEAVDIFPVQEGVLKLLFGEQVGRFAMELS